MRRYTILSGIAVIVAILMIFTSRNSVDRDAAVLVLCAPSLSGPMEELKYAFEQSEGNADGLRIENTYRGSAELLAMYKIGRIGDVLIAADVGFHDEFISAGFCNATRPLGRQFPCLIYRDIAEEEALSILEADASPITTSVPKPQHAAIGRRVASIVGARQYEPLVRRAKVSRETVSQVAADVSGGIVDAGIAWSTTSHQFSNLQSVVPPGWSGHSSQIGASVLIDSPRRAAAERFVDFLASVEARAVFLQHGFASAILQSEATASAQVDGEELD